MGILADPVGMSEKSPASLVKVVTDWPARFTPNSLHFHSWIFLSRLIFLADKIPAMNFACIYCL